jgi:hypothetical protein
VESGDAEMQTGGNLPYRISMESAERFMGPLTTGISRADNREGLL